MCICTYDAYDAYNPYLCTYIHPRHLLPQAPPTHPSRTLSHSKVIKGIYEQEKAWGGGTMKTIYSEMVKKEGKRKMRRLVTCS